MGVVTWTNLKIESIPKMDKILLAPVDDLNYAIDFLYRILPRRIGQEVLLLNNVDLAAILAEDWPGDFDRLKAALPPWTLVLVISGLKRRPEEKIAYEENFLAEVLKNEFSNLRLGDTLPGFPGVPGKASDHPAQPLAGRPALLEKPGQRGLPDALFPHPAGKGALFRGDR